MTDLKRKDIAAASERIKGGIHKTQVITSMQLNSALDHEFYFKVEASQKVGAFKARGALNTVLWAKESRLLTPEVVAVSSGNHGQAVAWAAASVGVKARVFMAKDASAIKVLATKSYGAEVVLAEDRICAEAAAKIAVEQGSLFIPPFDHDQIICGQGTACLEAIEQIPDTLDAIFAPVGGGGLLSGTICAAEGSGVEVFGVEPQTANDAAKSLRSGQICTNPSVPNTICDGVRTLMVVERTLHYLKKSSGILEVSETSVCIATQWLTHLLKVMLEPTAVLGFVGAVQWAKLQRTPKKILIILSGGNMDYATRKLVYAEDWLGRIELGDLSNHLN